ncbi:hypothetical protein V8D89_003215 [Ganoderma adspersum]
MAANGYQETPLLSLLSVLTTSIHTIEDELKTAGLPAFTLDPKWHPLDSLDGVPPPRLHEARRVAMAAANMIKALVQDVGTAMMDMSVKALDQTAYMLTADIDLLDVFKTEDEKTDGLHVDEIVARLPKEKKVDPQKLGRSLRLLSTEHWWIEKSADVFAPLRWALLNTPGTPSHAWADSSSNAALIGSQAFVAQMTDPAQLPLDTIEAAPIVRGLHAMGNTHIKNFWGWLAQDPDRLGGFARSMEGLGYINLPSLKADYPWAALPPDTTFVDVGAGQGTVSLHILRMLYDANPTLRIVLQDRPQHLQEGEKYWAQHLPRAIRDERVAFEPHDFFQPNPRMGPNTLYWFRFIMHDWTDSYCIKILRAVRDVCHPTSRILICDCVVPEAPPAGWATNGVKFSYEDTLKSIDNDAPYAPIEAPYPLPKNFGFATKATYRTDMLMYNSLNALERTTRNFEKIVTGSGFKISRIYTTRGASSIIEAVPN